MYIRIQKKVINKAHPPFYDHELNKLCILVRIPLGPILQRELKVQTLIYEKIIEKIIHDFFCGLKNASIQQLENLFMIGGDRNNEAPRTRKKFIAGLVKCL